MHWWSPLEDGQPGRSVLITKTPDRVTWTMAVNVIGWREKVLFLTATRADEDIRCSLPVTARIGPSEP